MVLVDEQTGAEISGRAPMGRRFFFRITNRGDIPLFVNVLDIASDGSLYDCLPIDAGGTMLHLLVPGNSTVDFRQYPMEFSEPAGTDLLVLTAYDRPFDLRRVAEALGMNRPADLPACRTGPGYRTVGLRRCSGRMGHRSRIRRVPPLFVQQRIPPRFGQI